MRKRNRKFSTVLKLVVHYDSKEMTQVMCAISFPNGILVVCQLIIGCHHRVPPKKLSQHCNTAISTTHQACIILYKNRLSTTCSEWTKGMNEGTDFCLGVVAQNCVYWHFSLTCDYPDDFAKPTSYIFATTSPVVLVATSLINSPGPYMFNNTTSSSTRGWYKLYILPYSPYHVHLSLIKCPRKSTFSP